jgi:DNA-binding transcriptional MocR family regulator
MHRFSRNRRALPTGYPELLVAQPRNTRTTGTACPWTTRIWQEFRVGNLTRSYRDILLTLHTFRGAGGECWPSHATLAERAGCSLRTVQRALRQGEYLGLVQWVERRVRAGWRWLRTSNRYFFRLPESPVISGMGPRPRSALTTRQKGSGGETSKKEALLDMLREAATVPDLLARRRQAVEESLLKAMGARRC